MIKMFLSAVAAGEGRQSLYVYQVHADMLLRRFDSVILIMTHSCDSVKCVIKDNFKNDVRCLPEAGGMPIMLSVSVYSWHCHTMCCCYNRACMDHVPLHNYI